MKVVVYGMQLSAYETVATARPVTGFKNMKNMNNNYLKGGCPEMSNIFSTEAKQLTHISSVYFINLHFIPGTAERTQATVRQKRSRYDGKPELLPRVVTEPMNVIACQWLFF